MAKTHVVIVKSDDGTAGRKVFRDSDRAKVTSPLSEAAMEELRRLEDWSRRSAARLPDIRMR